MSEIAIRPPGASAELVFDSDDIGSFSVPRDVHAEGCEDPACTGCEGSGTGHGSVTRKLGAAHLNITFKPGKYPVWRQV
jgi:hypothetical protein